MEGQLEIIEIKSQWIKRTTPQRFLPTEIKSLMNLTKAQAGNDIYKRIKYELIDLFGSKPEDAYNLSKSRVMTKKPSQLGIALVDNICAIIELQVLHQTGVRYVL